MTMVSEPFSACNGRRPQHRSLEDTVHRSETQLAELQQFAAYSCDFLDTIQHFMENSKKQQEEDLRMIAEQSIKTDRQFAEITSLFHSLMQKEHSSRSDHHLDLGRSIRPERPATPRRTNLQNSMDILRAQSKKTDERFAEITEIFCSIMKKDQFEYKSQGVDKRVLHSCNQDFHTGRTLPPSIHHPVAQQDSSDRSTPINDLQIDKESPWGSSNMVGQTSLKAQEIAEFPTSGELVESAPTMNDKDALHLFVEMPKRILDGSALSQVISGPLIAFYEIASVNVGGVVDDSLESIEIWLRNSGSKLMEIVVHAQELFAKRSAEKLSTFGVCVELFGSVEHSYGSVDGSDSFVFDPGTSRVLSWYYHRLEGLHILIFDPGGSEIVSLVRAKCAASLCRAEAILSREANEIE